MDHTLRVAYLIGCKLAMNNANEFQQVSVQATAPVSTLSKERDAGISDSTTRNLNEHNKHVSGASFGDKAELAKGIDSTFMN